MIRSLLDVPSPTGEEGKVAQVILDMAETVGLNAHMDEAGNVIATRHEGKEKTIILNGHMDTVPGNIPVEEKEGAIYGRGAVDMKGPLAGLLFTMKELKDVPLKYNVILHFVTREEGDSYGSWSITKDRPSAELAIIAEPTGLSILLGQRGRMVITAEVYGRPYHASKAREEDNAIYLAQDAVERIRGINLEGHDVLGPGKLTVTGINGGTASNVVPSKVVLTMDRRLTMGEDEDFAVGQVRDALEGIPSKVYQEERTPPISVPFLDQPTSLIQGLKDKVSSYVSAPFGAAKATTDASYYSQAGIPSIIFGPGNGDMAHTANEHIYINDVVDFSKILVEFLKEDQS